jgi:UDP-2,4-diacetamido-2,4,6-trideoxy-beta-L-altropyranose hydrolase
VRFVFRCDASKAIGLGHLARAFALADELRGQADGTPLFLVRPDPLAEAFLTARGLVPTPVAGAGYALADVLAAVERGDVVVSDSYELGAADLEALAAAGVHRIVVDDFAQLDRWAGALVVNPNLGADAAAYPGAGRVLAGADYALVRGEIRSAAAAAPPRRSRRVVVCLGGGRWPDTAEPLLAELGTRELDVRATLPASSIAGVFAVPPDALPGELAAAAVAVISGGVVKYEAAVCGTPSLLVSIVEHQEGVSRLFAGTGAARYLGSLDALAPEAVADAVVELVGNEPERARMARAGQALVDGQGAARVATALLERLR